MSILNTSVSGMLANSNWLSNISQNVANANSTGYKDVATEFSALVDQSPGETSAGAGVTASSRSLNAAQGQVESTTTTTDLAIQGPGFFVVQDAGGNTLLTRDGSFVPDAAGDLVNAAGYYLMGSNTPDVPVNSLAQLGKINVEGAADAASPSTAGTLVANLQSTADVVPAANLPSLNAALPTAAAPATGTMYTSATTMVAYDALGDPHTLDVYFSNTGQTAAIAATAGPPATAAVPAMDTWQMSVYDHSAAGPGGSFPYTSGPLVTQTIDFDPTSGAVIPPAVTVPPTPTIIKIPVAGTAGAGGASVNLDLSEMTQLATVFGVNSSTINGNPPGSLTGISIGSNGLLSFQYANGATQAGYTIPLVKVPSPDNLTSALGDAYEANDQSGPIQLGTAGATGLGTIDSSALEQSSVDLATELTSMVEAQSSYEANSKVFQTGSDILSILNNLKA